MYIAFLNHTLCLICSFEKILVKSLIHACPVYFYLFSHKCWAYKDVAEQV